MFSDAGNAAVHTMIEQIKELSKGECTHCHRATTESELRDAVTAKMDEIDKAHGEVYDTDVREQLYHTLKDIWLKADYDPHSLEEQLF